MSTKPRRTCTWIVCSICLIILIRAFLTLTVSTPKPLMAVAPIPFPTGQIRCEHFLFGCPIGTPETNVIVVRESYALSANIETKLADWVAYHLTPSKTRGTLDLARVWRSDPLLDPAETLEPADYKGASDFDRGHLAPLASFRGSKDASQVNYLSNIAPQYPGLNQGTWLGLEIYVRELTWEHGETWILTGPLFEDDSMPQLPGADEPHCVPSAFWKIVMIRGETPTAYLLPQDTPRKANFQNYTVTLEELEIRSGLILCPNR